MESKIDPKTIKIQAPGAVLEPSGDPLGGLGVSEGASCDFWRDLVEILGNVGPVSYTHLTLPTSR